jgi:hypothetical protein
VKAIDSYGANSGIEDDGTLSNIESGIKGMCSTGDKKKKKDDCFAKYTNKYGATPSCSRTSEYTKMPSDCKAEFDKCNNIVDPEENDPSCDSISKLSSKINSLKNYKVDPGSDSDAGSTDK